MDSGISLKKAALINAVSKYTQVILQLVLSMILARLISAEDYGVIAIVTVFTTFFSTFADMGFGSAVIQHKNLDEEDVNHIFSFTCYVGIFLMVAFCAFSWPLSMIYNNNIYRPIGCILSVSLLFSTLNMIPNAMLMKEKRFILVGIRNVVVSSGSSIIAIILAVCGFRYYALVMQSVIFAVVTFAWNYSNTRFKFRFKVRRSSIQKVLHFSMFQFGFNIVQYFSRNMDNLLTGKFIGTVDLGYYDKAYKLTRYPVENLAQVITPVLHPILSEYQSDKKYIYRQYLAIIKILSLMGIYFAAVFAICPKEIILIMYGNKWINSVSCLGIFSITIWTQMVGSCSGAMFQSLGKTNVLFITGLVNSIVTVIGFLVGVRFGTIEAVAAAFTVTSVINFVIATFLLVKIAFGYKYSAYLLSYLPEVIIGGMIFIAYKVIFPYIQIDQTFLSVFVKGVVITIVYVAGLLITRQYKCFLVLLKRRKK